MGNEWIFWNVRQVGEQTFCSLDDVRLCLFCSHSLDVYAKNVLSALLIDVERL